MSKLLRWMLPAALVAAALIAPTTAAAALPITFDTLAAGTAVDTEYTSSDGVTFIHDAQSTGFPEVTTVGPTMAHSGSNVAYSTCVGCEFVTNVIKGRFATSQDVVTMHVGINGASSDRTVTLYAYNGGNVLVGQSTVQASTTDFRTAISVDRTGHDDIVYFRVVAPPSGWQIGIDDINALDGGASPPDFALTSSVSGLRIRQGGSATVPIDILRSNGSNGDVDLSTIALPSGVTASFSPDPVTGTSEGPTTMTLTATNSAPLINNFSVNVQGAPASVLVGSVARYLLVSLTVEPAFTVTLPSTIAVPSCGSTTVNVNVNRAYSGFTGDVTLAVSGLEAGYSASLGSTVVGPPGGGAFANVVPLTISRTGAGDMNGTTVTVTGTSGVLPSSAATSTVTRFAGEVTGVSPLIGEVPRDVHAGSEVTISGRGLCTGSRIEFGNGFASVVPGGADYGIGNTSVRVRVPRLATTGAVRVSNPDGTFASTTPLTIRSPRNTEGFRFENYDHEGIGMSELRDLYGEAQTNITLDVCWPFGCNIVTPIPSPFAALYILISNGALSGNGSCYGMSVTSQQLVTGRVPYSTFSPSGATSVWALSGTSAPAAQLKRHIRTWHTAQLSSEAIQDYVRIATENAVTSGANVRAELEAQLRDGRSPLIMLRNGTSGHVLVAHDVRDAGGGAYRIDVYDPNLPFLSSEDTDGSVHTQREDASSILVSSGGNWSMQGAFGGSGWSGGPGSLINLPFSEIPRHPTMPTTLEGLASLIIPFADSGAASAQVVDADGHRLLTADGDLNEDPATRIPGAQLMATFSGSDARPVYVLPRRGTYRQRLVGTRAGTTGAGMLGPGFAARVAGLRTGSGKVEQLTFDAWGGEVDVHASTGGSLRAQLARGNRAGTQFGADFRVTGGDAGTHGFELDPARDGVRYENAGGASTVDISLTFANRDGTPGAADLPSVSVPAGGRVDVAPASWANLAGRPVTMVVRAASGRVVARRMVKPKATPRRVRSVVVNARTLRRTTRLVQVVTRFGSVPRTAHVYVTVRVLHGRKLVQSRRIAVPARTARGTRAYSFRLVLPRGTYVVRGGVGVVVGRGASLQVSRAGGARRLVAR